MKLFGIRHILTGSIVAAGVFAGMAARAQTVTIVDEVAVDEIAPPPPYAEPYRVRPYRQETYRQDPYRQGLYRQSPYREGPDAAMPMPRPPLEANRILGPRDVAAVLRARGYSPLGPALRRGWIYTIAVLNPNGDDGRLVVDARTGRVMRFVPAYAVNARFNDELAVRYGPPGPPPLTDLRRPRRPPSAVPKLASRTPVAVPLPRPKQAVKTAAPQAVSAEPKTVGSVSAATPPEAKPVEAKSVEVAPAKAKPVEVELKPTQDMPPVQTLD